MTQHMEEVRGWPRMVVSSSSASCLWIIQIIGMTSTAEAKREEIIYKAKHSIKGFVSRRVGFESKQMHLLHSKLFQLRYNLARC